MHVPAQRVIDGYTQVLSGFSRLKGGIVDVINMINRVQPVSNFEM